MTAASPISPASSSICSITDNDEYVLRRRQQRWLFCTLIVLVVQISAASATAGATFGTVSSRRISLSRKRSSLAFDVTQIFPRGGEVMLAEEEGDEEEEDIDDEEENDIRQHPEYQNLQSYRMKQQVLLQLRATFLSEALAKRGLPIPSLKDVSTPEGKAPPKKVDWDCAVSTEADPKHCLISYDPEPGSKLVVPMEMASTDKWITLSALNNLRRNDPSKVQPMWNDQYAILSSWFDTDSRYSLLQHVGFKGMLLSAILDGNRLPVLVFIALVGAIVQLLPIIEVLVNRFIVSGQLWIRWPVWYRYVHIGLPFKLVILQALFTQASKAFKALVNMIKVKLVDLECQIFEETIPVTIGEGSEDTFDDVDIDDEGEYNSDDSSSDDDEDEE